MAYGFGPPCAMFLKGVSLEQISTEEKLDLQTIQLDVEDETSVNNAFQQIGNVDILINNAGISPVGSVSKNSISPLGKIYST